MFNPNKMIALLGESYHLKDVQSKQMHVIGSLPYLETACSDDLKYKSEKCKVHA